MLYILHQAQKTINELHQKEENVSKELQHTLRFVQDKFTTEVFFFLAVSSSWSSWHSEIDPLWTFQKSDWCEVYSVYW